MRDLDVFCKKQPSAQNAVDIFEGNWKTSFPGKIGVRAGDKNFFENGIVAQVDEALSDGLRGARVLEIGPFEAHYTYQLERLGAAAITAVEVHSKSFLKCLVVKEVCGLRASFVLGDFMQMDSSQLAGYDLCFAAGVLYHQSAPLEMLKKMGETADRLYLWTHCYGDIIDQNQNAYPHFRERIVEEKTVDGFTCPHYRRSYLWKSQDQPPPEFAGGPQSYSNWLRKRDILAFLERLGYDRIVTLTDAESHRAGPVLALTAERSSSTAG